MKLTQKFEELLDFMIGPNSHDAIDTKAWAKILSDAVKDRDNEVFGWSYRENPDTTKLPETEEEIIAANNEKHRIAERMEKTI